MELLRRDHAEAKALLAEIVATPATAARFRTQLIERLATDLEVHAEIEHELFYPFLRALDGAERRVERAEHEHRQIAELLAEILGMDPEDEELPQRLAVLQSAVVDHTAAEEREMFRQTQDLAPADLEQLSKELAHRKRELQHRGSQRAA
jgi:hemerythrin superfamily protein